MVDKMTAEFLEDPNNLHNLTLTTYPNQQIIFLGKLCLAHESRRSTIARRSKEFNAETTRRTSKYNEEMESKIIMAKYKELIKNNSGGI